MCRWNFSVGQNELSYVTRVVSKPQDIVQDSQCATDVKDDDKKYMDFVAKPTFAKTNNGVLHETEESGGCWKGRDMQDESSDQCDIQSK
jgi:hypothetical protein